MTRNRLLLMCLSLSAVLAWFSGCSTQLTHPQSFGERLAYAAAVHIGLYSAVGEAYAAGVISQARGRGLIVKLDMAGELLDRAQELDARLAELGKDQSPAIAVLDSARRLIRDVQEAIGEPAGESSTTPMPQDYMEAGGIMAGGRVML